MKFKDCINQKSMTNSEGVANIRFYSIYVHLVFVDRDESSLDVAVLVPNHSIFAYFGNLERKAMAQGK